MRDEELQSQSASGISPGKSATAFQLTDSGFQGDAFYLEPVAQQTGFGESDLPKDQEEYQEFKYEYKQVKKQLKQWNKQADQAQTDRNEEEFEKLRQYKSLMRKMKKATEKAHPEWKSERKKP